MSNLPPPSGPPSDGQQPASPFGPPSAPGPPPPSFAPPPAHDRPPRPSDSNRRKAGIIAGVVVVAALGAGGVYFATRSDDSPTESAATTEEAEATEPSAADTAPETTTNVTEPPVLESTDETTTSAFEVPPGAVDLGHQVYLPVPEGWTQTPDDKVTVITDGTTTVAVQVLARRPGEAPADLMQEYVNTFDTDFDLVSYEPSRLLGRIGTDLPIYDYGVYYETWDPSDGVGVVGGIDEYIRADGLSALIDVYGQEDVGNAPAEMWNGLEESLTDAPPIDKPVAVTEAAPFRVTTAHPFIQVDGLVGFTPAPGFNPVVAGKGQGMASNGTHDFDVRKLIGQADINAAVASAQAILAASYSGIAYGSPQTSEPDQYGVVQQGIDWTGNYSDGMPSSGAFDVFYDPSTQNAYVVFRNWFNSAPGDSTEPNKSESTFMYRSIFNSFTNIP